MGRMQLVLRRSTSQEADLKALLDAQQDGRSTDYHKWLTPDEFWERFGVAESDIAVVRLWLESHGFQVHSVGKGRTVLEFSGTAAQVRSAFHTEIHKYEIGGEDHWANASDPRIPEALASVVVGPAALHDFRAKPLAKVGPRIPFRNTGNAPRPQFNQGNAHAVGPADFATIYNLNPLFQAGINGAGVTIGVLGVDWIQTTDVTDFQRLFGLPFQVPVIKANGTEPDNGHNDDNFEGVMDVSWAGAVATGANVVFIVTPPGGVVDPLLVSEQFAVDNNLADVLTESFSYCEADMTAALEQQTNAVRQQAAAEGITWVVASGDSGGYCDDEGSSAAKLGPLSANGLASSPYVVAVGGTEFAGTTGISTFWASSQDSATFESAVSYIPEVVWNDNCLPGVCASGGGPSTLYAKPPWQAGVSGIPDDGMRDTPDVSLSASPKFDPLLICFLASCRSTPGGFYSAGGTSVATPSFAGIMALVVQKTGSRQGAVNRVLYQLAATEQYSQCIAYNPSQVGTLPASSCIFNDVTAGNSAVPGEYGGFYSAGVGYDLATGLGSVNAANLVNQWGSIAHEATTTSLTAAPTAFAHGTSAAIQISVAAQNGGGIPSGNAVLEQTAGPFHGVFPLINGEATFTTGSLPGGTYNLTARYSGDGTFAASTSGPVTMTVTPEPSVISGGFVASLGQPTIDYSGGAYGAVAMTQRAHVAGVSGHGVPTGLAHFCRLQAAQGGSWSCDWGELNSFGDGNDSSANPLPAGDWYLYEEYDGDGSFLRAQTPTTFLRITRAPTVISVAASVGTVAAGQTVTLTAAVEGPGQVPGSVFNPQGSVTFLADGVALGQPVVPAGDFAHPVATFTTTLPVGINTITASYSGDPNHLGSVTDRSAVVKVVNGPVPSCPVIQFTASPNPIRYFDPQGVTTLAVSAACAFDIRIGSPGGQLFTTGFATGTGGSAFTKATGPWVTDGMTFYLQEAGNTTAQGTLQTLTVGVLPGIAPCVVYGFSAAPNPILTTAPVGMTTVSAYTNCAFDIRIGGPGGVIFTSGAADGKGGFVVSEPTGQWVSNGMQFVLQKAGDATAQGTLATLNVPVGATPPPCVASQFSVSPVRVLTDYIYDLDGTAELIAVAGCEFDVRENTPGGLIIGSGFGYFSMELSLFFTPMTYYLQVSGDSTPAGTLGKVETAPVPAIIPASGSHVVHRPTHL